MATRKSIAIWARAMFFALLFVGIASAQHHPPKTIRGAEHPEQIPLTLVLRQAIGCHPLDVPKTGLDSNDEKVLAGLAKEYCAEWDAMLTKRNSVAGTDMDSLGAQRTFWRDREALVGKLWQRLQTELSPLGALHLAAYLEGQKIMLYASSFDYGLGENVAERNLREARMVAGPAAAAAGQVFDGMEPNYTVLATSTPGSWDYSDNFAQLGNGPLDSNWTVVQGSFNVSSGQLHASGQNASAYYKDPHGAFTDMCSSVMIGSVPGQGTIEYTAATTRETSATMYYYADYFSGSSSYPSAIAIGKIANGPYTTLSYYGYVASPGDILYNCAIGSTIKAFVMNQSALKISFSVTDTTITGPGYPGIFMSDSGAGSLTAWFAQTSLEAVPGFHITGDSICDPHCPNGANHTPEGFINSNHQNGTTVPAAGSIDFQYGLVIPMGSYAEPNMTAKVNCSVVGLIWQVNLKPGENGLQIEAAETMLKITNPTGNPPYSTTTYCNTYTTPPDLRGPRQILNGPVEAFDFQTGWCTRNWSTVTGKGTVYTPWNCPFGIGIPTYNDPGLWQCSRWDAGCPGIEIWNSGPPAPTNTQCR